MDRSKPFVFNVLSALSCLRAQCVVSLRAVCEQQCLQLGIHY